jgi:hypothetical protein
MITTATSRVPGSSCRFHPLFSPRNNPNVATIM